LGTLAQTKLQQFNHQTDLFNPAELEQLLLPSKQSGDNSFRAWCLLNFVVWWEQYIAEAGAASSAEADFRSSNGLLGHALLQG
jgi:hypothetical protein